MSSSTYVVPDHGFGAAQKLLVNGIGSEVFYALMGSADVRDLAVTLGHSAYGMAVFVNNRHIGDIAATDVAPYTELTWILDSGLSPEVTARLSIDDDGYPCMHVLLPPPGLCVPANNPPEVRWALVDGSTPITVHSIPRSLGSYPLQPQHLLVTLHAKRFLAHRSVYVDVDGTYLGTISHEDSAALADTITSYSHSGLVTVARGYYEYADGVPSLTIYADPATTTRKPFAVAAGTAATTAMVLSAAASARAQAAIPMTGFFSAPLSGAAAGTAGAAGAAAAGSTGAAAGAAVAAKAAAGSSTLSGTATAAGATGVAGLQTVAAVSAAAIAVGGVGVAATNAYLDSKAPEVTAASPSSIMDIKLQSPVHPATAAPQATTDTNSGLTFEGLRQAVTGGDDLLLSQDTTEVETELSPTEPTAVTTTAESAPAEPVTELPATPVNAPVDTTIPRDDLLLMAAPVIDTEPTEAQVSTPSQATSAEVTIMVDPATSAAPSTWQASTSAASTINSSPEPSTTGNSWWDVVSSAVAPIITSANNAYSPNYGASASTADSASVQVTAPTLTPSPASGAEPSATS